MFNGYGGTAVMSYIHTAVYDSATFTRTTESRRYSHCIVRIFELAKERAAVEEQARKYWRENLKYSQEAAEGRHHFIPTRTAGMSDAAWNDYLAQIEASNQERVTLAKEWLAAGEENHVAMRLGHFDDTARHWATDGSMRYYVGGDEWCSRPDLAQKAVAKWLKQGVTAVAAPATWIEYNPKRRGAKS